MKKKNGSYTVEAAFIVPMITMSIIGLLYMSLMLHDRSRSLYILSEATERYVYACMNGEENRYILPDDCCNKYCFVNKCSNINYKYNLINATTEGKIGKKNIKVNYYVPNYGDTVRAQRMVE